MIPPKGYDLIPKIYNPIVNVDQNFISKYINAIDERLAK